MQVRLNLIAGFTIKTKELNLKKYIIYIFLAFYTLGLSAQDATRVLSPNELWIQSLQQRLDSIIRKVEKQKYTLGLSIYDLTADSALYGYQAQRMMKPASTQKLFVSTTALSTLGAGYCFQTHAYVDGNIQTDDSGKRFLKGDIVIRGSFDPTLQFEDFDCLVEKIQSLKLDSIDGQIVVDNQVRIDSKKVKNPQLQIAQNIHNSLKAGGMKFSTENAFADSPVPQKRGWSLASINTPISKVLTRMMKKSDNTYAECMLLNLADMGRFSNWTYDKCREKVIGMIRNAKGKVEDYTIIDGSGLSHDNRSTPELLTTILRYAYHNEDVFPALYESLPIAGVDGTLDSRMKSEPVFRNVRAKTGTLNGVSTLAGYVTAANGHQLCFSIMVNNLGSISPGKSLQNDICLELAK